MFNHNRTLKETDIELWNAILKEETRQEEHIELIASENYVSQSVMQAQGSQLTNKYAEGYPGKRYYGGCEFVDVVESLAIDRAKQLFNADYANVQPHSGSQANAAVFASILNVGDTILGMNLSEGGHLTHGSPVNFSGKLYNVVAYGVDDNGYIDYKEMENMVLKNKPRMIIGGFSAYSRKVDWKKMREIADLVGAYLVADIAHIAGLIIAGAYPSPIDYAHIVTTTTHKTLAGPRGGLILSNSKDEELYKRLNSSVFPYSQGGPLMHVIAAKATAFKEAMSKEFKDYQLTIVKYADIMAKQIMARGYNIVSNGTENHLFVINFIGTDITGRLASDKLDLANITVNKNTVPKDPKSPFVTSGIRIGTAAITRRGFQEADVLKVANLICDVLDNIDNDSHIDQIKQQVLELCKKYPVYKKEII